MYVPSYGPWLSPGMIEAMGLRIAVLLRIGFIFGLLWSLPIAIRAEGSLALYGTLDMGMSFQQATANATGTIQGGSKFGLISGGQTTDLVGLMGKESLGSGVELNFVLENAFALGNGAPIAGQRIFNRQAWFGLQSNTHGYFRVGRQFNFARDYLSPLTPFSAGDFTRASAGVNFASGGTERLSNTIKFETSDLAGIKFGVGYSFSAQIPSVYRTAIDPQTGQYITEQGQTSQYNFQTVDNLRSLTSGIKYNDGPLYMTVTMDIFYPNTASANNQYSSIWSSSVGGFYDFGLVKLAAAYGQTKNGWINGFQPVMGTDRTVSLNNLNNSIVFDENVSLSSYLLAFTMPVGSSSQFFGAWRRVTPSGAMRENSAIPMSTQNAFSLGYTHDITKRTNIYLYSSLTNDYATIDGLRSVSVGLGVRHKF